MGYVVIDAFYSKEDKVFHIIKRDEKSFLAEKLDDKYACFEDFYKALNGNLKDVNLLDFDFEGCDLKKYNLKDAKISSKTMLQLGVYNPVLYRKIIEQSELLSFIPSQTMDIVPTRDLKIDIYREDEKDLAICYISDMHLNHKILKKFPKYINKFEMDNFFKGIIAQIKGSLPSYTRNKIIIFVGDISYDFDLLKAFFKLYEQEIFENTYFILGNHELWDQNLIRKSKNIEDMVACYREFFNSINIQLLENQLCLSGSYSSKKILTEKQILNISDKELRKLFASYGYGIFGGIGYAGLNNTFCYNQGIYRNAPLNHSEEIERSKKVELIHRKLGRVVPDKKIIFVTHMPKSDWTKDDYQSNWIYLSGHTHKNFYFEDETKRIYADNQIGYEHSNFALKYTSLQVGYDIFCEYADGIYEITREQYILFNLGLGNRIELNRKFEKLYMLKREKTYCFLIKLPNSPELKLLNGGALKNAGKHDINYFYDNLFNYAQSVKNFLDDFNKYLRSIQKEVRTFGGIGRIHGCIVDIDFYNHLYVNPLDGKITPYFAYSITDKYVYPSLFDLLEQKRKDLLLNYKNNLCRSNVPALYEINTNNKAYKRGSYVPETDIYRTSRIIKGLRYTTKYNIVRLWNDAIPFDCSSSSGKLIVKGLMFPDEIKKSAKKSAT